MPAIATLTLNDGQTVPVAHTFSPVTTDGSKAKWADRAPAIPAGFLTISNEVVEPSGSRTTYKHSTGFMTPVVATVDSVAQVVRYSSAGLTLNIHPDSTLQERQDLLAYIGNLIADAAFVTSVENLEPFY